MNGSGKQSALLQHSASRFGAAAAVATHGSSVPTKLPPMNLSPQLSTPARGPCTLLKGRGLLAVALEAWGLGAVNLLAYTVVGARPTGPE